MDLSAAITKGSGSSGTTVAADGNSATFAYNGTYALNKVNISGPRIGYYTQGNNVGMDGSVQFVDLTAGKYKLEVWGAQGGEGYYVNSYGGKGGYSYGTLTVTSTTRLYIAIGGRGSDTYRNEQTNGPAKGGGWNGGGHLVSTGGATGGGATHIALTKRGDGQLKNYENYTSEVLLVAGGGGGGAHDTESYLGGGGGGKDGGQSGQRGGYLNGGYTAWCHGLGATTTVGGGHITASNTHVDKREGYWNSPCSNGSFGMGGNGTGGPWGGGGGGGGWYGGGGGCINGGGGGSGYVNTSKLTDYGGSATDAAVRTGHGTAKITLIGGVSTQSSTPTITLNRNTNKAYSFLGTSTENSLLGKHSKNLALSAALTNIYQVNDLADDVDQAVLLNRTFTDAEKADAAVNSWLAYSFDGGSVSLKAKRYWTGTKPFYVKVKDTENIPSWFKFYATVEGGELKKDQTPDN